VVIETALDKLVELGEQRQEENEQFKAFLKTFNSGAIDHLVQELNQLIAPQIDCTACGNCCSKLMINISDEEIERMAGGLQMSQQDFTDKYVQEGSFMKIINAIPCPFLSEKKCTAYEVRPGGCREFPKLEEPGFTNRLFGTFTHYSMCPIIFNVVEQLKVITGFYFTQYLPVVD
jgi:Fe-S-cluster containining protein